MDYYVDTSYVYPQINWAHVAPYEPKKREEKLQEKRTEFIARTEFTSPKTGVDFFRAETGPLAPTTLPSKETEHIGEIPTSFTDSVATSATVQLEVENSDVDRIAKQRVQLIAAKYASNNVSSELVARLEILNRRLLDRAPRVSEEQVLALENAHEQLLSIQSSREARAKRRSMRV